MGVCRPARFLFVALAGVLAVRSSAGQPRDFQISIGQSDVSNWGFEYPVTYVFRVSALSSESEVFCRVGDADKWAPLPRKNPGDCFNGVPCVRLDPTQGKAYVSVGFRNADRIQLRFANAGSAAFEETAKYYDARKAAYTLSLDNWGRRDSAHPGAPWLGMTDDRSDKYQAAVHACRMYHLPVSVAVNSRMYGGPAIWSRMQEELDPGDQSWEPAVHTRHHPCNAKAYLAGGYAEEIVGCRDDILEKLRGIPYGQHVFEFILPCGYHDDAVEQSAAGQFLFVRDWNGRDNPASADYASWNVNRRYYGIGGEQTTSYDAVMEKRRPKGRYYAEDAASLNRAFDAVRERGGVFYAMWHADRYENSVLYDVRPGADGAVGSTLMQHFAHVANRSDVWYVANGWLHSYRFVAEHAKVED